MGDWEAQEIRAQIKRANWNILILAIISAINSVATILKLLQ